MVHFYIDENDLLKFHKLINENIIDSDNPIIYYYNNPEVNTLEISLQIDKFVRLTDIEHLRKIELLNN